MEFSTGLDARQPELAASSIDQSSLKCVFERVKKTLEQPAAEEPVVERARDRAEFVEGAGYIDVCDVAAGRCGGVCHLRCCQPRWESGADLVRVFLTHVLWLTGYDHLVTS